HRLPPYAPRYGGANYERCSGHVPPSRIQTNRSLPSESDRRCHVHGVGTVTLQLRGVPMRNTWFLSFLLLFTLSSFAATAGPVSYKSGDETVQAILYTPQGKGPFPGIVVIHEWWGLNDWVKEQAVKLADQGYVALAIDLYRGKVATTPEQA